MKLSTKNINQADIYFRNEMTETELSEFNMRLNRDENLHSAINTISLLQKGIEYSTLCTVLNKVEEWEQEVINHKTKNRHKLLSRNYSISLIYLWSAIASIIAGILILCIMTMKHYTDQQELIKKYFEHQHIGVHSMRASAESAFSHTKESAFNFYENKDYKLAATALERIFKIEGDYKSLMYSALSNVALGKLDKAEKQITIYLEKYPNDKTAVTTREMIYNIRNEKARMTHE